MTNPDSNNLETGQAGLVGSCAVVLPSQQQAAFETGTGAFVSPCSDYEPSTNTPGGPGPVLGCTDPVATNYNALATFEDGSCTYPSPIPTLVVSAGANQTIQISYDSPVYYNQSSLSPLTCTLTGFIVSGTISGEARTYMWAQVSGPGLAVMPSPGTLISAGVVLPLAGAYVFRLTVASGARSATSITTVTATAKALAVSVYVPPIADRFDTALPQIIRTNLIPGRTCTYAWTFVSGPGTCVIVQPSTTPEIQVNSFSADSYVPGSPSAVPYVVSVIASDGFQSASANGLLYVPPTP